MAFSPYRVLLIDDDEDDYLILALLFDQFQRIACELIWASGYASGLYALGENEWDLVLLDYDLGAMSGLDLILEAGGRPLSPPVLLISGRHWDDIRAKARTAGVDCFISKEGLNAAILEKQVRQALEAGGDPQPVNARG